MLTCHPNICIPPEGPFVYLLAEKWGSVRSFDERLADEFVDDVLSVPKMEYWELNPTRLRSTLRVGTQESFRSVVRAVYEDYMLDHGGLKPRWGDKSGSYAVGKLALVRRALGDCVLLHIIRDGRDVVCSYRGVKRSSGPYAPQLPSQPALAAYEWQRTVAYIRDAAGQWPEDQRIEVRYEDLVSDPEGALRQLCRRLGEDYSSDMLRFHEYNAKLSLEPSVYMDWKAKTVEAVTLSQVGRWQRDLTTNELATVEAIAGGVLSSCGYELSRDGLDSPWRQLRLRLLMARLAGARKASRLARRCSRISGRLWRKML